MNSQLVSDSLKSNRSIFSQLSLLAELNPLKPLVSIDGCDLSGSDFLRKTQRISLALICNGVKENTKVALIIPNSIEWFTIFWSIVKVGGIPVPLDPQAGEWEMIQLLGQTECTCCFVARQYRANKILENMNRAVARLPLIKKIICIDGASDTGKIISLSDFLSENQTSSTNVSIYQPVERDLLMLACTSGSTGNPKIIAVPHCGFFKSQKDMADYLGFNSKDAMLLGMPLYHQGGFGMGLQMLLNGGTVLYQPLFDPVKFLTIIKQSNITVIQLTATLAKILLSVPDFEKYDISSVKIAYFAGEKLPMEIAREFFEKRNIRVVNVIGSTETATMVVWDSDSDSHVDVNDFRALAFTEFRVVDDSEEHVSIGETGTIYVHTDALLHEYYGNAEETSRKLVNIEGKRWFNTGDLGMRVTDDRVRFIGRVKRIIKRGSNLVCPEENESFLLTHPEIAAVAVTGEKHELFGEMIVAYIQPKPGCILSRGDIVTFCNGKLAAYKIPDKVVIVDSLPHDIGKIQYKYIK